MLYMCSLFKEKNTFDKHQCATVVIFINGLTK